MDPDEPGYNGTIYTVAVRSGENGVTKHPRMIRDPYPAYCPPWGPYVVSGYMKVPDCPYPLSPLVATAEQAEEVNAHTSAAAQDAKRYKRIAVFDITNQQDGQQIKRARHGEAIGVNDPNSTKEIEIGGVSEVQYKYNEYARERLGRVSGLSGTMRGEPEGDTTATAESIANSAGQTRIDGIKKAHRRGVERIMRTAVWYMHHGEDVYYRLGSEGEKHGLREFAGGILPGMEVFNFFDLTLNIEPYSMEHTDQAVLQRRITEAWDRLISSSEAMVQTPFVEWQKPLRAFFETLNIEDADQWVDFDMLEQMQMAMTGMGAAQPGAGQQGAQSPQQAPQPGAFNPNGMAAMQMAQEQGGLQGAARSVV